MCTPLQFSRIVVLANDDFPITTNLPALPKETWSRIAYFYPRMPGTERWMPWRARQVNRTFKAVIESYYIEHFLKTIELDVDVCGTDGCGYDGDPIYATYTFEGFEGRDNSKALVQCQRYHPEAQYTPEYVQKLVCRSLRQYREPGYSPSIILQIENGATDMLPMDLNYPTRANERTFSFDWRTFFCTLFYELGELKRRADHGWTSCVELSRILWKEVYHDMGSGLPFDAVAWKKLMDAPGQEEIGCDGRLIAARRFRRHRLGIKSGQIKGNWRTGASTLSEERFEILDERRVAQKLSDFQAMEGKEHIVW